MNTNYDKRELRIFLSSTFRDMQVERDYLIKHIFPEVRKACRERLVEFTEIDLRWGVTKEEAEQGRVVRICLEEIDRCRPYFLSFLGERYGWSPVDSEIEHKQELVQKFPVVETSLRTQKSVTEMEILHGVLEHPSMADHSFFYFRSSELTRKLGEKSGNLADYLESEESGRLKLIQLKNSIRASGLPLQEHIASIEELGEFVKRDLLVVLDKRYPKDTTPSLLESERLVHEAYAEDRYRAYIPNPADIEKLDQYVLSNLGENSSNSPLIITGESGLGKSSLLAYWLEKFRIYNTDHFIIQHYAGISGDANAISTLRRIMAEIKERTQDEVELPTKPENIIKDFPLWLAKVRSNDQLILILDGLNQIEGESLNWLPSLWPANVRLILSTLPGDELKTLQSRGWQIYYLQPMVKIQRSQLIKEYLASYRKALSTKQMHQIASATQCGNPLFLHTLLEELRIFGVFEQLDNRIASYLQSASPAELFDKVLARMELDYGKDIVDGVMSAIWAARKGLSETELLGVTGFTRLDISAFLLALDYHLARRDGLLCFFHDYLRHAVQVRYLRVVDEKKSAHLLLATYFDKQPLDERKVVELPWQWQQCQSLEKLKDCISDIPLFVRIYAKNSYELLSYWVLINDKFDPGECYTETLNGWVINTCPTDDELCLALNHLGSFFEIQLQKNVVAAKCYRKAISIRENNPNSGVNIEVTLRLNLANLLIDMGELDEAEHHCCTSMILMETISREYYKNVPLLLNTFGRVFQAKGNLSDAKYFYEQALEDCKIKFGVDHEFVAYILSHIANLAMNQGDASEAEVLLQQALAMLEKSAGHDNQEISNIISHLAGISYKNGDLCNAESLCRRALEIKEKTFGPHDVRVAQQLLNLAVFTHGQDKYSDAEMLCRRALDIQERNFGTDDIRLTKALALLARLMQKQGNYSDAENNGQRALVILEKTYGPDHNDVAVILKNQAECLKEQGNLAGAVILSRRALVIRENSLGLGDFDVLSELSGLASDEDELGNYSEAEYLYQKALNEYRKVTPTPESEIALTLYNLGVVYRNQGRQQEAELSFRESMHAYAHDPSGYASSIHGLARILLMKEQYQEALDSSLHALDFFETESDSYAPWIAVTRVIKGLALKGIGQFIQASDCLEKGLLSMQASDLADHQIAVMGRQALLELRVSLGVCK